MKKSSIFAMIGNFCLLGAVISWCYAGMVGTHERIVEALTDGQSYDFKVNDMIWKFLPPKNEG